VRSRQKGGHSSARFFYDPGHDDGRPQGLRPRRSILVEDLNRALDCFGGSVHGRLSRKAAQVGFERLGALGAVGKNAFYESL
jgi:hypothetical protein